MFARYVCYDKEAMTDLPHINQSQVKTWRNCTQQWDYQYGQHLVRRRPQRPLYLGSWVHACLEGHYRDGDWRVKHAEYVAEYGKLFEEERLLLDDGPEPLPSQVARIMRSYTWYRRNEGWEVIAVEVPFEVPITRNLLLHNYIDVPKFKSAQLNDVLWVLKGRIDLIVEDADGLKWVVDHKTAAQIPEQGAFHAMEPQLILYPWAAELALGIKTAGVIYNYLRSAPPTVPSLNKDKTISKRPISTDYPTVYTFLKDNGLNPKNYQDVLLPLKAESPFLARYRLPREEVVTRRILEETATTARAIMSHEGITRNVTRNCEWCPYKTLCRAELFGLDTTLLRTRDYAIEDVAASSGTESEVAHGN